MKEKEKNLLDLIPEKIIEGEINPETGLIVIKKLKYKNVFLKKYLIPRMPNPYYRIKLDSFGSFIWNNIDGKKRVSEIAEKLGNEFGEKVQPVYERVGMFIKSLLENRFIKIKYEL